jgi:hypothetical protein
MSMSKRINTPQGLAVMFFEKNTTPSNKKYSAITPKGKLVHFGDPMYAHYEDKVLGLYENSNHYDKKRRKNFRSRHRVNNINDPEYPIYYSYHYLW